jgi:CheY-like chemotaxis protein
MEQTARAARILIVDDEQVLVMVGMRHLTALGHQPVGETDPFAALERFRQSPDAFDLIVTDYSMPLLNGLRLARAIHEIRPAVPIVMVTGYTEVARAESREMEHIARLIPKPVTRQQLDDAIGLVFGR